MASAYGNTVHHWRARVVAEITSQTATQATVRTRAYWCSIGYGYNVYANGEAVTGSYSSGKKQFVASSGTGQSVETLVAEVSHTYNKGDKAQSIPCKSVVQVTGGFGNGTSTANTSVSIPAIDYDAPEAPSNCSASRSSDSQAKVEWTNGSTSTTKPRSSTKVERRTDGGDWEQVASVGASATNYTDNGISANHRYAYRVRANGAGGYSGYDTSGYIYTTPAAPTSVLAEKTGAQSVRLSIEGAAPWATSYDVERSTDVGSQWAAAGTAESFPWVDASAPAGTVVYRVRAVRGSLQSAWSQSNGVTTITPPLAPTVTGLPAVVATGSALTVSWVPNHPDGSAQEQAQVEYTIGDGEPQTATVEGAATSYQLPASATESAGTVKVRVRTHGLDEDWGAWSGYSTVAVAVPPSAHFTNPAQDGAVVAALPLALAWEASDATGVSSQTLSLLGADGTTLLTRQLDGAARSLVIDDSVYALANLSGYELVLTVLGGSSLSTVAGRSFSTDWAEPSLPAVEIETDPDDLSVAVTVHAGEAVGAEAVVAEVPEGKTLGGAVVYGSTRQNLWVNPSGTRSGVTVTSNEDGSMTISGTNSASNDVYIQSDVITAIPYGKQLTVSSSNYGELGRWRLVLAGIGGGTITEQETFLAEENALNGGRVMVVVTPGTTVNATVRVMLNEGTEPAPWCPPGLNGVDELSIVTAGKNLASTEFNNAVSSGVTFNTESDGSISAVGTATSTYPQRVKVMNLPSNTDMVASKTVTGDIGQGGYYYFIVYGVRGSEQKALVSTKNADEAAFNTGEYDYWTFTPVAEGNGVAFDCRLYTQLELGPTATAYEPPAVTTTPVDLDGHTLNALPDGTRDELRIEPDGRAVITKRVGSAEIPSEASGLSWEAFGSGAYFHLPSVTSSGGTDQSGTILCDVVPPRKGNDGTYIIAHKADGNAYVKVAGAASAADIADKVGGGTLLYPLAEPVEVELPPVSLSLAGPGSMWADAPVPAAVSPVYMLGSSFSVVRVLANGSQWMVADGLTDGQQCIDPLPPLNVDFSYLVTAYAETGVSSALSAPARVDAALSAFNFGDAAATCELARLDPSWSHSPMRSGTLYHFADGGEAGGLPVPYGGADVDSTRSMGFTLLDLDQLRRLQDLASRYYTCWYRDVYGGRALCAVSWSFSSGVPYRKVEVTASMTEAVFEEAW